MRRSSEEIAGATLPWSLRTMCSKGTGVCTTRSSVVCNRMVCWLPHARRYNRLVFSLCADPAEDCAWYWTQDAQTHSFCFQLVSECGFPRVCGQVEVAKGCASQSFLSNWTHFFVTKHFLLLGISLPTLPQIKKNKKRDGHAAGMKRIRK